MIQHYTKIKEVINPITGSNLSAETEPSQLSQEKSILNVKRREIEAVEKEIDKWLAPLVDLALENGEEIFMDFWKVQKGATRFNESLFLSKATQQEVEVYNKAKESLNKLMENPEYYKAGKPSLRYPKV